MAEITDVDFAFLYKMAAHHADAIGMATGYLATPVANRRSDLSAIAKGIVSAQTQEIKSFASILGVTVIATDTPMED